jgi:ArsR family transcriptional regulator
MCNCASKCLKPEMLLTRPEDCPWEQIRRCHGEVLEHPCVPPQERPEEKP